MTVWIVQQKNKANNGKPFDFSAAEEFGEIKYIFSPDESAFAHQPAIYKLKRELVKFKKEDSLILIGEPALTGAAMVVVAQYNQLEVPLLIFERFTKSYYRKILKF